MESDSEAPQFAAQLALARIRIAVERCQESADKLFLFLLRAGESEVEVRGSASHIQSSDSQGYSNVRKRNLQ